MSADRERIEQLIAEDEAREALLAASAYITPQQRKAGDLS